MITKFTLYESLKIKTPPTSETTIIVYHGTDMEHDFSKEGNDYRCGGTFFSTEPDTAYNYGTFLYKVIIKPNLNLFYTYKLKDCKKLFTHFYVSLIDKAYDKNDTEYYYITTPEQLSNHNNTWEVIEENKDVIPWLKNNHYDGVVLLENGVENILLFTPVKEKLQDIKLIKKPMWCISPLNESPHAIKWKEFGDLYYTDSDTIAFGYYDLLDSKNTKPKLYLSPQGTHGTGTSEFYIDNKRKIKYPKNHLKYNIENIYQLMYNRTLPSGRIWTESKIMTFWKYPTDYQQLMKTINDIFNEADIIRKFYPLLPKFDIKYIELPKKEIDLNWNMDTNYQSNIIIDIESYDKYVKDGKLNVSNANYLQFLSDIK